MFKDKRFIVIWAIAIIVPIIYCVSLYSYASGLSKEIVQASRLELQHYYDKFAEIGFVDNFSGATKEFGRVVMKRESYAGSIYRDEINYFIDKSVEGQKNKGYASSTIKLTFNSKEGLANIADETAQILDIFGIRFEELHSTIMEINWQDAKDHDDALANHNYDYKKPVIPSLRNAFGSVSFWTDYYNYPEPDYYLTIYFIAK